MAITTIRLKDEELNDLRLVAKDLGVDQSTVLKRAIRKGVDELRIEFALEKYARRRISFAGAARLARVSGWRLLDEMKLRGVYFLTDEDALKKNMKELI